VHDTSHTNAPVYRTITGRQFDVAGLNDKERKLLAAALDRYQKKPEWSKFASWWMREFDASGLADDSPIWRICQDLEARLGISQGKVALPDYRDYLADLIEEKYGTRYKFCKEVGLDQGYLSRVLAGQAGLSLESLAKFLRPLDSVLVVRREQELRSDSQFDEVRRVLAALRPSQRRSRRVS